MNGSRTIFMLAMLLLLPAVSTVAQEVEADSEQLRRLISALEAKLEAAQNASKPSVSQIGRHSEPPREAVTVIRIYRLDDLFVVAPAYNAFKSSDLSRESSALFPQAVRASGGGAQTPFATSVVPVVGSQFGGGLGNDPFGSATNHAAVEEQRTSASELIDLITSVIEPTGWDEVGGANSIAMLGSSLVVKAEPTVHEQIDSLLDLMRKQSRALRTVSVDAYWLWLTESQLQSLRVAENAEGETHSISTIDHTALLKLIAADGAEATTAYRAAVTCHNGQTVYAVAGGQTLAVTDMVPVAVKNLDGENQSTTGYRPHVSLIQEGAALQVTPAISTNGGIVMLDVHSRVITSQPKAAGAPPQGEAKQAGPNASPAELSAALDRPRLSVHRLSTTMRAPVDQTVLVGGMTMQASDGATRDLYLLARVRVEELRDAPAEEPLAEEESP